ncbi:hypothetical protein NDU88_004234 [Pleurodeles waltl]|uniref:Uncharacterized protein n=1 Tax=Pleurodeles waltl TaxID=8319 RepID=A0AAV7UES6_PLEWA|nr:hypothetical protein NDU88_004234 [Pleurodeles waltl]
MGSLVSAWVSSSPPGATDTKLLIFLAECDGRPREERFYTFIKTVEVYREQRKHSSSEDKKQENTRVRGKRYPVTIRQTDTGAAEGPWRRLSRRRRLDAPLEQRRGVMLHGILAPAQPRALGRGHLVGKGLLKQMPDMTAKDIQQALFV